MLKTINLDRKMSKKEYKKIMDSLEVRLAALQREAKAKKIPVMVVFEGWGAAGKGTLINRMIAPLDPRGFKVFTIQEANEEEKMHPFMWRFWTRTPAKGRMHIFDRSWYRKVANEEIDDPMSEAELKGAYKQIHSFEEQLSADGTLIIKFFLHITAEEQKKRFEKLDSIPEQRWRVTKADWKHNKQYDQYLKVYDRMLEETDFAFAQWHVIEATDRRYASAKVMTLVADILERKIRDTDAAMAQPSQKSAETNEASDSDILRSSVLAGIDLNKTIGQKAYKKRLDELQSQIEVLHSEIYRRRIPVIVAMEGWDAGGKGGAIKRLTQKMDPRGYEVVPTSAPNDIEKEHHYLWRFWQNMPKDGHVAIFDRTWYGRVMVERIEGFCSEDEWRRAYKEMNQMEEDLYAHGAVVLKFWLHIDKDEQERRFKDRMENPDKQWKITDEDWRNRDKWEDYEVAVDEMILRTSTSYAPWHVIEANSKMYARIKILEIFVDTLKQRLGE